MGVGNNWTGVIKRGKRRAFFWAKNSTATISVLWLWKIPQHGGILLHCTSPQSLTKRRTRTRRKNSNLSHIRIPHWMTVLFCSTKWENRDPELIRFADENLGHKTQTNRELRRKKGNRSTKIHKIRKRFWLFLSFSPLTEKFLTNHTIVIFVVFVFVDQFVFENGDTRKSKRPALSDYCLNRSWALEVNSSVSVRIQRPDARSKEVLLEFARFDRFFSCSACFILWRLLLVFSLFKISFHSFVSVGSYLIPLRLKRDTQAVSGLRLKTYAEIEMELVFVCSLPRTPPQKLTDLSRSSH